MRGASDVTGLGVIAFLKSFRLNVELLHVVFLVSFHESLFTLRIGIYFKVGLFKDLMSNFKEIANFQVDLIIHFILDMVHLDYYLSIGF